MAPYEEYKSAAIVHNHEFFDSYLEAVLSRGDLLLFLNGKWLRETRITRMATNRLGCLHILE